MHTARPHREQKPGAWLPGLSWLRYALSVLRLDQTLPWFPLVLVHPPGSWEPGHWAPELKGHMPPVSV